MRLGYPSAVTQRPSDEVVKTVMQVIAILMLLGLFAMLAHKAYADFSALARQHSGADFWLAFLRYVFRNMAG